MGAWEQVGQGHHATGSIAQVAAQYRGSVPSRYGLWDGGRSPNLHVRLNKIPAAAAWFMLDNDGGRRNRASQPSGTCEKPPPVLRGGRVVAYVICPVSSPDPGDAAKQASSILTSYFQVTSPGLNL
ncbi:hypothetical protein CPLU01_00270 [Colletotrichum plurivorum]|uniref:Uncharacterized protein n=1 Tax=Colletotrichum plurivorum TaxID=2175906 RepID=A0A8H6NS89_9PEZI|nr:hypothetical protein CPLU01_00270 [Colletotrichum plurivorum]